MKIPSPAFIRVWCIILGLFAAFWLFATIVVFISLKDASQASDSGVKIPFFLESVYLSFAFSTSQFLSVIGMWMLKRWGWYLLFLSLMLLLSLTVLSSAGGIRGAMLILLGVYVYLLIRSRRLFFKVSN